MDALIFIDTNIFLDFYRIRRSDVSMSYLKIIDKHKDIIITGRQVEMEFKKNRQKVILESHSKFKSPDWGNLSTPPFVSELQAAKQIEKKKKEITTQQKKINEKIEKILKNPSQNDPVYQTLQRLFANDTEYNLDRGKDERFRIRNMARKRFSLGYPPRKKEDTSIGDSLNWEWIVQCALDSGKDIIVVTRDTDYGAILKGESYLNDWLKKEFQERVSKKRKILLTERLSVAFKKVKAPVSKEMEDEENRVIEEHELSSTVYESSREESRLVKLLREFEEKSKSGI